MTHFAPTWSERRASQNPYTYIEIKPDNSFSANELASIISSNQPHLDRDEALVNAMYEARRQRRF
jgi:hypothetical protein